MGMFKQLDIELHNQREQTFSFEPTDPSDPWAEEVKNLFQQVCRQCDEARQAKNAADNEVWRHFHAGRIVALSDLGVDLHMLLAKHGKLMKL